MIRWAGDDDRAVAGSAPWRGAGRRDAEQGGGRSVVMLRGARLVARIEALAAQLDTGPVTGQDGVEASMARLEAAVTACVADRRSAAARVNRLAVALSHVTDAVVLADEHGEIVFRNARAEAYAGARHGDALVERTLVDLLARALAGHQGNEALELWGPPHRMLELSALPLHDGGEHLIGALAMVEDVSEKRRLDAVRRDFVANIGHELKTPVGALSLLSEALEEELDAEDFSRLTASMRREALRLGQIIDDLLDLSRIEAEEVPVREPVAAHLIVEHAVERVRTKADHQAISIDVAEIDPTFTVLGDRRQLVNALDNLLENAVKYSDEGSAVRVTVSGGENLVAIVVEDHGIGIPARDVERIFERFYRVDRARARDTGGTGLGLSIVRHIAHNHGGEVHVVSREGEGTTFTLTLPAGAPAQAPAPPQPDHGPAPVGAMNHRSALLG